MTTDQPTGTRPEIDPELSRLLYWTALSARASALNDFDARMARLQAFYRRKVNARLAAPPSAPTGEDARPTRRQLETLRSKDIPGIALGESVFIESLIAAGYAREDI